MNKSGSPSQTVNNNEADKNFYTYILLCRDNTLYTGWTNNLKARENTHNSGCGAKYTKARLPVKLVYWEAFETKSEAMKRECKIKTFTRKQKLALIEGSGKISSDPINL